MKHSDEIDEILELMRQHGLTEFELERDGFKVRLKKGGVSASGPQVAPPPLATAPESLSTGGGAQPDSAVPSPVPLDAAQADGIELAVVKAPIVGTFYRAPEPGAANFVEVGDAIRKGQVLCIIEAMKLMNEIESDYDGEVATVYVDSGLPVQYGERLFAIKAK